MNTNTRKSPAQSIEREMLIVGIMWIILGGICVIAANAWAMGI